MEIKSFKKKKNNKYELTFEDNSTIELYDDVIIKYNLLVNKKLDEKKFDEITKYNSSLDAYFLSLKYLNSKMRTKLEIKKYLDKQNIDSKTINDTIDKLVKNKAIDEDLYVKSFVNDQINFSTIGPYKIANKLFTLGISKDKSMDYINSIDKSIWIEKITKLVNKKIKVNKNYSIVMLKNKILSSICNEGYDKSMIISVLNDFSFKNDPKIIIKEYNKIKNKLSKKYDGSALECQIKMKLKSKGFSSDEIDSIR